MPDEQSAMMLIVPVGATQVIVAFRTFKFLSFVPDAVCPVGKAPSLFGQFTACLSGLFVDEFHN